MFDINALALNETFDLHLVHPVTGDKLYADKDEKQPVTITIFGTSSKAYRNAVAAMQNRQLRRTAKKDKPSAEVMREESLTLLVAISKTSANLSYNGEEVTSEAVFRKLYADPKFSWLRDQADEAVGDIGNFLAQ